jgi:hypothetical protein
MADRSNLIYPAALISQEQREDARDPQARQRRLPWQKGTAGRLAPLLTILALSLLPLGMSAVGSLRPATHGPRLTLVVHAMPLPPAASTDGTLRPAALFYAPRSRR